MKTFNYTLHTNNGETIEGSLLSHQRELPKSAKYPYYHYDLEGNIYSVYKVYSNKSNKIFIIKHKELKH